MKPEKTEDGWISCAISLPPHDNEVEFAHKMITIRPLALGVFTVLDGLRIGGKSWSYYSESVSNLFWRPKPAGVDFSHASRFETMEDDSVVVPQRPLIVPQDHSEAVQGRLDQVPTFPTEGWTCLTHPKRYAPGIDMVVALEEAGQLALLGLGQFTNSGTLMVSFANQDRPATMFGPAERIFWKKYEKNNDGGQ